MASSAILTAGRLVRNFLERYIEWHPYVCYHRHDFQLALGCEAWRVGMNEFEFEELLKLAETRLAMPNCDAPEIRRNLSDAYRFAELNGLVENPKRPNLP